MDANPVIDERTGMPHPSQFTVTDGLPPGWWLHVRPGPFRIGYRVSSYYDLSRAPQHARDEAAALGITPDLWITRSWAITKDRAVRFARVIVGDIDDTPKEAWL